MKINKQFQFNIIECIASLWPRKLVNVMTDAQNNRNFT